MNHYIAQTVFAVRDHSTGAFAQGDEFLIYDRLGPHCKCGFNLVAIGIRKKGNGRQECSTCGTVFSTPGDQVYFRADIFVGAEEVERRVNELLKLEI